MRNKTGSMTIKISGPAGCGKSTALLSMRSMFESAGLTVAVCDEYLSRDPHSVSRRKEAEESDADVVIIAGEVVG